MNNRERFELIARKTRQRLLFAIIVIVLYFSFVLNYSSGGSELVSFLAVGGIPGALVMFAALIIVFIGMELLFLFLNRDEPSD